MRGWILGVTLAALMPGCLASFDRLARELDHLDLPADYVLLEEDVSGDSIGYSGSPRVIRTYRSPRPFKTTCEEIRAAARSFSRGASELRHVTSSRCNATFERHGFVGGISAVQPRGSEPARSQEDFVRVYVQIIDS